MSVADELIMLAKTTEAIEKGYKEIIPHTSCKGKLNSVACHKVAKETRGCALKYYCQLLAENGAGRQELPPLPGMEGE
ncbi:hypothetical protein M7775_18205 [Sporomusa sphaeroides DSM 2875]|uniref:hypothetical protein n=1 Tax=Sporomusa sphaeroides TaxID=47679 RepID=UPI00202F3D65|nr:hypothetical protein [Sporomusa sphaeroides]MCM0760490.1 hypothetical protein [Sporomusa sphaeroides DSM 2875]